MKTPCVNVCQMDPEHGLCRGCLRTLEEIGAWSAMSDAQREQVIAELPARRAAPAVPSQAQ